MEAFFGVFPNLVHQFFIAIFILRYTRVRIWKHNYFHFFRIEILIKYFICAFNCIEYKTQMVYYPVLTAYVSDNA